MDVDTTPNSAPAEVAEVEAPAASGRSTAWPTEADIAAREANRPDAASVDAADRREEAAAEADAEPAPPVEEKPAAKPGELPPVVLQYLRTQTQKTSEAEQRAAKAEARAEAMESQFRQLLEAAQRGQAPGKAAPVVEEEPEESLDPNDPDPAIRAIARLQQKLEARLAKLGKLDELEKQLGEQSQWRTQQEQRAFDAEVASHEAGYRADLDKAKEAYPEAIEIAPEAVFKLVEDSRKPDKNGQPRKPMSLIEAARLVSLRIRSRFPGGAVPDAAAAKPAAKPPANVPKLPSPQATGTVARPKFKTFEEAADAAMRG